MKNRHKANLSLQSEFVWAANMLSWIYNNYVKVFVEFPLSFVLLRRSSSSFSFLLILVRPNKKVILFLEIGRVKIFLSLTRPHSRMCIRVCIFDFKKQTNKQKKNKDTKKKQKKLKKKREYLRKIDLKKFEVCEDFCRHSPASPETRVFFF